MLSVPMRALGVLSRLLVDMSAGNSLDIWEVYLSRVMQPKDHRLGSAPIQRIPVSCIAHRHSIRNMQPFGTPRKEAGDRAVRLYMATAVDAVQDAGATASTGAAR